VAKADFAAFRELAWKLVPEEAIHQVWDWYSADGARLAPGLEGEGEGEGEGD
jgi:hypothetical protein